MTKRRWSGAESKQTWTGGEGSRIRPLAHRYCIPRSHLVASVRDRRRNLGRRFQVPRTTLAGRKRIVVHQIIRINSVINPPKQAKNMHDQRQRNDPTCPRKQDPRHNAAGNPPRRNRNQRLPQQHKYRIERSDHRSLTQPRQTAKCAGRKINPNGFEKL